MAAVARQLDQWLDNDTKPRKRPRDGEDDWGHGNGNGRAAEPGDGEESAQQNAKRARRELLRRFACPFAKHEPARYKNVKTCCGPGWTDTHRVKEHIYRRHSLKNACNRCFEFFKDAKELKEHQRAQTSCQLQDDPPTDVITEKQEEQLRARAKAGAAQAEKWQEMYRIIFPDAKVPSPYYEEDTISKAEAQSRFKDLDECKAFVRREVLRAVHPVIVAEVEKVLQTAQVQVLQKANELVKEVQNKIFRTLQYQSDQAVSEPEPEPEPESESEPTPEPTPEPDHVVTPAAAAAAASSKTPPELHDFNQWIESISSEPLLPYILPDGGFHWDACMVPDAVPGPGVDCVELASDSAYFTSSHVGAGVSGWDSTSYSS